MTLEAMFNPVEDSKIQGVPDGFKHINYGGAPTIRFVILYVGGSKGTWERALLEFDISSLNGETLTDAKLTLEVTIVSAGGAASKLQRITRPGDWPEAQVDWVDYDHSVPNAWTAVGGDKTATDEVSFDTPTSTGPFDIDQAALLTLCDDALDNRSGLLSVILFLDDEDPGSDTGLSFWSKEGLVVPLLTVTYEGGLPELADASHQPLRRTPVPVAY